MNMKQDGRDEIDDLFRSKLYDFETGALADDVWVKIEKRLNKPQYSLLSTERWKRWAVAAAIALLALGSGFYFIQQEPVAPSIADKIAEKTEELKSFITENEPAAPAIGLISPRAEQPAVSIPGISKPATVDLVAKATNAPVIALLNDEGTTDDAEEGTTQDEAPVQDGTGGKEEVMTTRNLRAEIKPDKEANEAVKASGTKKTKRWGLGMGAGSITASSNNAANIYAFRNTMVESPQLDYLNSFTYRSQSEIPKTDIKHRQPVSFGLSASYMLTPRWYLQAGLNYSYLSSSWTTNGSYYAVTKQRLHFVGLPVALSYKIAEWNSFMWYTSAGFMPEVNVAGKLKVTNFSEGQKMDEINNNTRMKEWYWSVNAATGVSYPLVRFLNAFAEIGAGYYFDNGSKMETIHSDKPFNVNFSFGLRLGF